MATFTSVHSATNHAGLTGIQTITYDRLTADETKSSTSLADSGLSFAVSASTVYKFRFVVFFTTNATTVGIKLSVNGPTGTYRWGGYVPNSAGSGAGNTAVFNSGGVADSAAFAPTSGPGTNAVTAVLEGIAAIGGSGGTLVLRHGSETATDTTILANSFGELVTIA